MNPRDLRIGERRSYLERIRREEAADRAFAAVMLGRVLPITIAVSRRLRARADEQDRKLEALIAQAEAQPPRATDAEIWEAWGWHSGQRRCASGTHRFVVVEPGKFFEPSEVRCIFCQITPEADEACQRHLHGEVVHPAQVSRG